ncbi:MAG: ectoine/hydroxyectoine ABC transporter permease subunit EhuC [Nocardioidaceae bacterium]
MQDLQLSAWSDDLLSGLWVTVYVTLLSSVGALVLSFVLGLLARMKRWAPRTGARVVIEFFRGTSLLVQLFWLYFVLPQLGIQFDPLAVAVIGFSLNFGAYGAEVVRGAINAVPKPQWEGSIALSLSPSLRMRRVILPQALPLMLPPFNNLLIQLLKSTPLVFLITLQDLTYVGDAYRLSLGNETFIFPLLLVVYFILSYVLTLFMRVLEVRAKTRLGQPRDRRGFFKVRGPVEEEALP